MNRARNPHRGPTGIRWAANYATKSATWLFRVRTRRDRRARRPGGGELLALGGDHHDHLAALEARALLDDHALAQVGLDALGHFQTQLLVGHLAALEADVDLDLVAFLQEAAQVAQLDGVVADVGGRA